MPTTILWFRQDLRLADNAALAAAAADGGEVLPVYVDAPDEAAPWAPGGASRWWLHHSLAALTAALEARGAPLVIRRGPSAATLVALAAQTGARRVVWNRCYEPALAARDQQVARALEAAGVATADFPGPLLAEPGSLATQDGNPYRVFTPFWRALEPRLAALAPPARAPRALRAPGRRPAGLALAELGLLPTRRWDAGFGEAFVPGEAAAQARLAAFLDDAVADYDSARDRPDAGGTSRLSPHLHFGELTPRQVVVAASAAAAGPGRAGRLAGTRSFVREIGWREFAAHVLHHFPATPTAPLNPEYAAFPWREDPAALAAWCRGRTGIPLVDAGMRELWHTGFMHNRVRMVVASFLTKNLGLHWLHGARWFHDTLLDADLASNTLGWQWAAGCGADAAPYYRVFNPTLQAERFDPARAYLRRWLPELARLPDEWLHRPFAAPAAVLDVAGVRLGGGYPAPIVDLKASRERALAAYAARRGASVRSAGANNP
jgi:deoxyribodipyrimidine photo-lyase